MSLCWLCEVRARALINVLLHLGKADLVVPAELAPIRGTNSLGSGKEELFGVKKMEGDARAHLMRARGPSHSLQLLLHHTPSPG